MKALQDEEGLQYASLLRIEAGKLQKEPSKMMQERNEELNKLIRDYDEGIIDRNTFLRNVGYKFSMN